jgi:glutamate-5-semialdehyde dehydrogenase
VSLEQDVVALCRAARAAAPALARASTADKNAALHAGAKALRARTDDLIAANADDVAAAREAGGAAAFIDRLTLTPATSRRYAFPSASSASSTSRGRT